MLSPPTDAASRQRPKVLVVDNEPYLLRLAEVALGDKGFAVITAENGKEALSIFPIARPDLVLLDMSMPIMDGCEACSRLRRLPTGQHVPILMMTGHDDAESIQRSYDAGATDFVVKPVNWMILCHRLEYMLRASRSAAELRQSQSKLATAQRLARLGYWEWDLETNRLALSRDLYRILGREPGETRISAFEDLLGHLHPGDRTRLEASLTELLDDLQPREIGYRVVLPDGSERFVEQQAEPTLDDKGQLLRILCTVQDVTERKEAEQRIRFLAYYDALTDLPNRRSFAQRLDRALGAAQRQKRQMGVMFLDLDRFKRINDSLGHSAGDQLLQEVSERLLGCVRATDCVGRPVEEGSERRLIARLGGDEFVFLLSEISSGEDAARVAQRVVDSLADSFTLNGQEVFLTASIGIALYPEDGRDADTLIKNADTAMYAAKSQGGNTYRYYAESMNATALERLMLESDLGKAVERGELLLHYQPQFDIDRRLVGAEALVRWQHPERGMVSPGEFIPLAEKTGLIAGIGEWVLETACAQAAAWRATDHPLERMAVNVSSRQLEHKEFPQHLARILDETGLEPGCLELELTESSLMEDADEAVRMLKALKAMGVRLSIDDFGTGYSSLSYLMRFPLDALKIDRSFLNGIPEEADHVAIASAIIAMSRSLRLKVVAEGVETEEQVEFLRRMGCDEMQGFLLARPMPAEELGRLLVKTGGNGRPKPPPVPPEEGNGPRRRGSKTRQARRRVASRRDPQHRGQLAAAL